MTDAGMKYVILQSIVDLSYNTDAGFRHSPAGRMKKIRLNIKRKTEQRQALLRHGRGDGDSNQRPFSHRYKNGYKE